MHKDVEVRRAYKAEHHQKQYRERALSILGGVCVRCGFDDPRALQIDHIHGGGSQEKKLIGGPRGVLRRVIAGETDDYQLLCANCNWIKRAEKKETRG